MLKKCRVTTRVNQKLAMKRPDTASMSERQREKADISFPQQEDMHRFKQCLHSYVSITNRQLSQRGGLMRLKKWNIGNARIAYNKLGSLLESTKSLQ